MLQRTYTILIERLAFWLCAAGAVTMALLPTPPRLSMDRFGDKFEHMLAFAVLAGLAAFAFPAMPRWRLIERLSFMGALIEVAQSIPALHRDCDVRDWVADTLAVMVVFGALWLVRLPRGAFVRGGTAPD